MCIKVIYGLNMVDQWWLVEGSCNRVNRLVMRSSAITNYMFCLFLAGTNWPWNNGTY